MNKTPKPENKKKQFIAFGTCSLLALVLCMVALVVTVKNVEKEKGNVNEANTIVSKTELTGNADELAEYISTLTKDAQNKSFIKVDVYTDIAINNALSGSGEDMKESNLLSYVLGSVREKADSLYGDDVKGVFGKVSPLPYINADHIKNGEATFSIGLTDENGEKVYENDVLVDEEYYYLSFKVSGKDLAEDAVLKTFGGENDPDIKKCITEEISSVCKVKELNETPGDFIINMKVERETDHISYMEVKRAYNVEADVLFTGSLSQIGEKNISFTYEITQRYEYFYAGISFIEDEVAVGVGDEAVLNVNAVIEDDSDYKVTFTSSDEGIATVDEMGYVKGVKASEKPVVITVELQYMGEAFTDECIVRVE